MRKMTLILAVLMFVMATSAIFAQNNDVITIVPFASQGFEQGEAETLTELFISEYAVSTKAQVADRSNFNGIIAQHKFQLTEWSNNEKVAKLGVAMNANKIICGRLATFGSKITFTVRLLDVNSTKILNSVTKTVDNPDELLNSLTKISKELAGLYYIGATGPGGGIVFYESDVGFPVKQEDGSEKICHYLEVSSVGLESVRWCTCSGKYIRDYGLDSCNISTIDEVGAGYINTSKIIKAHGENSKYAALLCSQYKTGTTEVGEWYLPSKVELDILYKNLRDKVIATGSNGYHWSSSQYGNNLAWYQRFSDGYQDYYRKDSTYSVRAVRAF